MGGMLACDTDAQGWIKDLEADRDFATLTCAEAGRAYAWTCGHCRKATLCANELAVHLKTVYVVSLVQRKLCAENVHFMS